MIEPPTPVVKTLCRFVSPARVPCVALAASGSSLCAAHRDEGVLSKVKARADERLAVCAHCQQPLHPGQIARATARGVVHATGCPEKRVG
jgi:hypothetical protein